MSYLKIIGVVAMLATQGAPGAVFAHGLAAQAARPQVHEPTRAVETAYGRQGDPGQVVRSITVDMTDDMRFTPATLVVSRGETVRLKVVNKGQVLHELVLGTAEELERHHEEMRNSPGMPHEAPQMVHVHPGRSGDIVWQFTQAGDFRFGCLLPGHYEAGMAGKVVVR